MDHIFQVTSSKAWKVDSWRQAEITEGWKLMFQMIIEALRKLADEIWNLNESNWFHKQLQEWLIKTSCSSNWCIKKPFQSTET